MLFSTFLMWLLADLFDDLPEAGDLDKPKLVFFLDEAHLLFNGASKAFLDAITTTVRLIRSKGVGIFFVTQTPKDVPAEVLGQLANRVQHALRAYTPEDAKALKATVSTFPMSDYDLEETLTSAGIGEAVITVMNEKGAPTPVALTRLRAPESVMGPSADALISSTVAGSALLPKYGTAVDNVSAYEKICREGPRRAPRRRLPPRRPTAGRPAAAPPTCPTSKPRRGGSRRTSWAVPAAGPRRHPNAGNRTAGNRSSGTAPVPAAACRRQHGGRPGRCPWRRPRRRAQEHGPLAGDPARPRTAPRRLRHGLQAPPLATLGACPAVLRPSLWRPRLPAIRAVLDTWGACDNKFPVGCR